MKKRVSRNNKGLSTVVTTLIIILLVLVSVGIIWGVVSNLLTKNTNTIATSTMCLDIDIKATKVVNTTATGNYSVTLSRSASGDEVFFYAKLIFSNSTDSSTPIDFASGMKPLYVEKEEVFAGILEADKVQVTPYYRDESGNELLCSKSAIFTF